jgi:hypothetical protein
MAFYLFFFLASLLSFRTPFAATESTDSVLDSMTPDEVQNFQRQKMYERIITYKDQLIFERRKSRSSNSHSSWQEPSDDAKELLQLLIKSNKGERLKAKDVFERSWISS